MSDYLNFLRTGSGSDEIRICLNGDASQILIRRKWMGSEPKQYKLACRQHELSTDFGLLTVDRIEAAMGDSGPFELVALNEEEVLLPLVVEYAKVLPSPVYVHEESQLAAMAPLGYASWNESFDLILMVHDFDWRAESEPLTDICSALDKRKFALSKSESPTN
jgi:hypothetical protein